MLVLRRKAGEALLIGDDIELVILEVEGDRVKVGLQAPQDIEITRKELIDEVTEENKRASSVKPSADLLKQLQQMSKANKRN